MDKDQRAAIATALMSSRPSIKEAGFDAFGEGIGTVSDAVEESLKPKEKRRPGFNPGSQVSRGLSQVGKALPGMVPLQTRNFATPDLPKVPMDIGPMNRYTMDTPEPGVVNLTPAQQVKAMEAMGMSPKEWLDHSRDAGYARTPGSGTMSATLAPVALSPYTRNVLNSAKNQSLLEDKATATARVADTLTKDSNNLSWWQKLMGPQSISTPMRRDAMKLYNQGMALWAAGRKAEAKELFRQYETTKTSVEEYEKQAEPQYAPFRNKVLGGGGILLFLALMLSAIRGGNR